MTLRTAARQAPLSTGFSRQEDWSGLPLPSPGDLPDPGIKAGSPALKADSLASEAPGKSQRFLPPLPPEVRELTSPTREATVSLVIARSPKPWTTRF